MIDLLWHYALTSLKIRSDCPHKRGWQIHRGGSRGRLDFFCAGCRWNYSIGYDIDAPMCVVEKTISEIKRDPIKAVFSESKYYKRREKLCAYS